MNIFSCREGEVWNDYTGECVCDDEHEFDEILNKCVRSGDYTRVGFPGAETIEEIMEEIGPAPGTSRESVGGEWNPFGL